MRRSLLAIAVATATCATAHAGSFIPLATPNAQLTKISQNGEYAAATQNLRWIRATGAEGIVPGFDYSNGINNLGTLSGAVPQVDGATTHDIPALYALGAGAPQILPLPADTNNANVYDVADDNSAVGLTWTDDFSIARAYYWTVADGVVTLPTDNTTTSSRGNAISADGSVIGGWNDDPTSGFRRGVVWVNRVATYVHNPDGAAVGEADGVSGNGQFVVGSQYPTSDGSSASWRLNTTTGEVTPIPNMPFAFGVSDDGKTIVGASGFFDNPPRALYIWTEAGGSELFSDHLAARAIEVPAGWILQGALSGVSGDGSIVGGWGGTANGNQSFIVTGVNGPIDKLFADGFDPPPPPNPVHDSGFEATTASGGPNPFWDSLDGNPSAGGGTSFDSAADFGIPTHGGGWAVWFGGWRNGNAETQEFSQSVTMPASGPQFLHYWRFAATAPDAAGTLVVSVDGTPVETTDLTTASDADYVQQSIDISAYADGAAHLVKFQYDYPGGAQDGNTFIDDVSVDAVSGGGPLVAGHRMSKPVATLHKQRL
jgi:hypothetical protein